MAIGSPYLTRLPRPGAGASYKMNTLGMKAGVDFQGTERRTGY